jgi:hypothetical protein
MHTLLVWCLIVSSPVIASLPLLAVGLLGAGYGRWRAGAHQRRIERAEAHVRHLEGQLHRARTNLAILKGSPSPRL